MNNFGSTWKVFIICSSKEDINLDYYKEDNQFSSKNYAFFNVGKNRFSIDGMEVINASDIPNYRFLGRHYAESEVIYNVEKLNLFREYDYIGFIHYDFEFKDTRYGTCRITENIDNLISKGIEFISFFTGEARHIFGYYNVLMDERKPNCLFVRDSNLKNPISVNQKIISDINRHFNTNICLGKFSENAQICLCCSFLMKRNLFDHIGKIIEDVIDNGCLEKFDLEKKHRFPGQVVERYIAVYSLLNNTFGFNLVHNFVGGKKDLLRNSNAENY